MKASFLTAGLRELLHLYVISVIDRLDGNFQRKRLTIAVVLQEHVIVSTRCDCYSLAGSSYSPASMNMGATEWIHGHASILRGAKRVTVRNLKI
jgi:hypothetical protein